ncbi:MAG: bifunctional oligoribonuclease/PAP phosphatase NrnA [Deltaproteobacteria bacterium]|nr:bifunctional oligoribonuclease/PAP phosphatase NrnA [Deltaproteobacteria bacterium]
MIHAPLLSISELIKRKTKILIVTHIHPDADAIGSSSALWLAIKQLGKEALFYLPGEIPYKMEELSRDISICYDVPCDRFDLVIFVDCANVTRIGPNGNEIAKMGDKVICLDHHISHETFADLSYIEPEAPASAVIMLDLLESMTVKITSLMAELLYAGLCDDTGCFRWSSNNANTFRNAAKLVEYGARPDYVAQQLYFTVPERVFKLRGLVLERMQTHLNGKIALVSIDKAMLEYVQADDGDTDGLIDELKMLASAVVAVMIRETDRGWKFSLRSKNSTLDVNLVAANYGGGGHKMAAGYTVKGDINELISNLVADLKTCIIALEL